MKPFYLRSTSISPSSLEREFVDDKEYVHDAFVLFEDRSLGRAELGLTHSIARKMGLGLPDVGYLRINEKSILYKKTNRRINRTGFKKWE